MSAHPRPEIEPSPHPPTSTTSPATASVDDRLCELCDRRRIVETVTLAEGLVVALCARCFVELARDGIDLDDDEESSR